MLSPYFPNVSSKLRLFNSLGINYYHMGYSKPDGKVSAALQSVGLLVNSTITISRLLNSDSPLIDNDAELKRLISEIHDMFPTDGYTTIHPTISFGAIHIVGEYFYFTTNIQRAAYEGDSNVSRLFKVPVDSAKRAGVHYVQFAFRAHCSAVSDGTIILSRPTQDPIAFTLDLEPVPFAFPLRHCIVTRPDRAEYLVAGRPDSRYSSEYRHKPSFINTRMFLALVTRQEGKAGVETVRVDVPYFDHCYWMEHGIVLVRQLRFRAYYYDHALNFVAEFDGESVFHSAKLQNVDAYAVAALFDCEKVFVEFERGIFELPMPEADTEVGYRLNPVTRRAPAF